MAMIPQVVSCRLFI